jgi:hypothetical protein
MKTLVHVMMSALLLIFPITEVAAQQAVLIEARNLAYNANYRNDQAGLRSAIEMLQPLAEAQQEDAYANYYLSWAYWALSASQVQGNDTTSALESAILAVDHARLGLSARDSDPEFHTALANALIVVAVLDRSQFSKVSLELMTARRRALELGPDNPRTVLMDAGMIFNTPPEVGGGQEPGLARWQKALSMFEAESNATTADTVAPRWGHALALGWLANLYLGMTPPQKDSARRAAESALRMRPDFWFVREQVLPRLRESGTER